MVYDNTKKIKICIYIYIHTMVSTPSMKLQKTPWKLVVLRNSEIFPGQNSGSVDRNGFFGSFMEGIRTKKRSSNFKRIWLVVSTPLKNIGQIGKLPPIGMNIKNIWNHQPEILLIPVPLSITEIGICLRWMEQMEKKHSMVVWCCCIPWVESVKKSPGKHHGGSQSILP